MRKPIEQLRFPLATKTITIQLRVRSTEFAVLVDALAGTLRKEAIEVHGCRSAKIVSCKVNGTAVR